MTGRPSKFTQKIADLICERIAAGETLAAICKDADMPETVTVWRWREAHESFRSAYARARVAQMEAWADEIVDISDDGSNDWMKRNDPDNEGYVFNGEHAQRSRLRVDTRKFLMAKIAPKVFGEKTQLTNAEGDGPAEIVVTWGKPSSES